MKTVIHIDFIDAIVKTITASSKDETRLPLLSTVHIEYEGNKILITSTSGYVLVRRSFIVDEYLDDYKKYFPHDSTIKFNIDDLKRITKKAKYFFVNFIDDEHIVISSDNNKAVVGEYIRSSFPRVDAIIPSRDKYKVKIAFNVDYLKLLLNSLTTKSSQVVIEYKDDNAPLIVSGFKDECNVGIENMLLMPMVIKNE